jgi:hypothetical protein
VGGQSKELEKEYWIPVWYCKLQRVGGGARAAYSENRFKNGIKAGRWQMRQHDGVVVVAGVGKAGTKRRQLLRNNVILCCDAAT